MKTASKRDSGSAAPDAPKPPRIAPGRRDETTGRKPNPVSEPDAYTEEPGEGEGTPTEVDIPNEDR